MSAGAIVFYVLQQLIYVLVNVLQVAMLVRAVLSWFDPMQEGKLSAFLMVLTEPIILPMRMLCEKLHLFEGFPLDIPFFLTWILLSLIQTLVIML